MFTWKFFFANKFFFLCFNSNNSFVGAHWQRSAACDQIRYINEMVFTAGLAFIYNKAQEYTSVLVGTQIFPE